MKRLDGYMAGVNLGCCVSQYAGNLQRDPDHHFDRFITEEDIQRIADFGFDHVRVPFDYPLIEDDDKPFVYKESGFAYLDNCVAWCRKAGINLVLDLHRAPGFSFNEPEKSVLFGDPDSQARFLARARGTFSSSSSTRSWSRIPRAGTRWRRAPSRRSARWTQNTPSSSAASTTTTSGA